MNYQEFLSYIEKNISEYMNARELKKLEKTREQCEEDFVEVEICYEAHLHTITKNNGIILDGITLLNKGEQTGPNVYLNSFFESYQMGKPLQAIMEEIVLCHEKAKAEMSFDIIDILDFDIVKERIIVRLVNYEKNKEQLSVCPYIKYLDLAITFRILANKDVMGVASSMVSNKEFAQWGVELDDLYQIARFNTMREFPWQMESLVRVVSECFGECLPESLKKDFMEDLRELESIENRVTMFVLTNEVGINGATSILYDNVIKNFARMQDCNVFILPSSVHEVMLVPENAETEPQFLEELVTEANQSAVGLIDLLSDNIYYYDQEKDSVCIYEHKE